MLECKFQNNVRFFSEEFSNSGVPSKSKDNFKILGNDFTVMASMGHVRDLPKSSLGFDLEDNFKPKYMVTADKKKVISDLKKQISKDTTIYLAADEDREEKLLHGI